MYEIKTESFGLQDLLRPDIIANPYPVFRRLRLEDPIHEDPTGEGWIISRYDDVAFVLADRRFSAERTLPQGAESAGARGINPVVQARPNAIDKDVRFAFAQSKMVHPARYESITACGNVLHSSSIESVSRAKTEGSF